MDNHWYKQNYLKDRKRHTLHSLSVGIVFFVFLYILTKTFSVSLCPIKNIFKVSCFGCGMTRGFISILNLDFKAAFTYNVLSIPLFVGTALYGIITIIDIIFNKNCIYFIEKQLAKKYMYAVYLIILVIATILNNHF